MMFGSGESFDYVECSKCGCLQIIEIPDNMGRYYPNKNYYSFENKQNNYNALMKILINKRDEYCLLKNNLFGKLINIKYPNQFFSILGDLKINNNSKILDVGCGSGKFLFRLKELNFNQLSGIDLYVEKEVLSEKLEITRKNIHQLHNEQKFDLILFQHSLEHMYDPFETFKKVGSILSKNGICIVRMPVKTNYIWKLYGVNWVQIDAPRHFLINTLESFNFLLEKTNFKLQNVIFDSNDFVFRGSEQYKLGIPLNALNSYSINPKKSIFTPEDIKKFQEKAKELNKEKLGDQAMFVITKS
ncbi:class I SAM-dependent methyltransferase [Methanobacterium spitsbergense]|uniref:Class I SAM-dependent methyltransferase n=1 Tax=Methanobacterium spitsbergense TaxID=2874285 RepID=A0A8T5V267_9EURY|nr:class I SAM-dependent methyltransferase [Methanobacterium spitsbergense]MBZ2167133.1 class I SAM-dependent methyltransferase [Methanobacterium spitsbergense]